MECNCESKNLIRSDYRLVYEYIEDGFFIIDVGCHDAEQLSIIKEHAKSHRKNIYAVGIDKELRCFNGTFKPKLDRFLHKRFQDVDSSDNLFGKADLVTCIGVGNGLGIGEKQRYKLHMQLAKFLKPNGVIMIECITDYSLMDYSDRNDIIKFMNFMTREELIEHSKTCVKDRWFKEKPCIHGILIYQILVK